MLSYQVREYYEFLGEKLGCLESSFKNIIESFSISYRTN